jgi:hypothetical protein
MYWNARCVCSVGLHAFVVISPRIGDSTCSVRSACHAISLFTGGETKLTAVIFDEFLFRQLYTVFLHIFSHTVDCIHE